MGVDVILNRVEHYGQSTKKRCHHRIEVLLDDADVFANSCTVSGLPMLSRVDPFKSLILTSAEMEQFLAEVETLQERGSPGGTVLAQVAHLGRLCLENPDMELHLEGD
jgi:hypothetical protein